MARPTQIVLDASVIIKWFVKEHDSTIANEIKSDLERNLVEVLVPSLFIFEILNVLRYKQDLGSNELGKVLTAIDDLQLTIVYPCVDYGNLIINIAYENGITIYDASYIALGELETCLVVTADEKLIEKVQKPDKVRSLQQYEAIKSQELKLPTNKILP